MQNGSYVKAIEALERAEQCPDAKDVAIHYYKGSIYLKMKNYELAVAEFKKDFEQIPKNVGPLNEMAEACKKLRRYKEAIDAYMQSLKIMPEQKLVRNNLAIIYAEIKNYKEAEKWFRDEIKINPGYLDAYFNLGLMYKEEGREKEMLEMWEKALQVNPQNRAAMNALRNYRNKNKTSIIPAR